MAAFSLQDVRLNIDPEVRGLLDQFMPQFVIMLETETGKNLNLSLLCLLADKNTLNYVATFLGLPHCETASQLHNEFYDMLNVNELTGISSRVWKKPTDWFDYYPTELFFMGSLNQTTNVEAVIEYLKSEESEDAWPGIIMGTILAGAYYGAHDDLIYLIEDETETWDEYDDIKALGMFGVICSGRYHYFEDNVNMNDIDDFAMANIKRLISFFMISKANVDMALSRTIIGDNNKLKRTIVKHIFVFGNDDICIHILTNGVLVDLEMRRLPYRIWKLVREHKDKVKLSRNLMIRTESLSQKEIELLDMLMKGNSKKFERILARSKEVRLPEVALWTLEYNNISAFRYVMSLDGDLSNDIRIKHAVVNKAKHDGDEDYYQVVFGEPYPVSRLVCSDSDESE